MGWSRLQSASKTATGTSTSQTVTYGSNLSSGTKLIVAVSCSGNNTGTTFACSVGGNAMTLVATHSTAGLLFAGLYALDTPAGLVGTKPTVTFTESGGVCEISMMCQEVSGLLAGNTTAMMDGTPGGIGGNSNSGSTGSPTYSSAAAGEYLAAVYCDDGGPLTWTVPPGYTGDPNGVNTNSLANVQIAYSNSSNGVEAGSYGLSGTAADWAVLLGAFQLAPVVVTIDAVGPSSSGFYSGQGTLPATQTWTHVCGGSATALTVAVTWDGGASPITAVSYAGTAMTRLASIPSNNSGSGGVELWYLGNPAPGSNTVSVSTGANRVTTGGSVSYNGSSGHGTPVTNFGSSTAATGATGSVSTTTTTGRVVAVASYGKPPSPAPTATSPATLRFGANGDTLSAANNSAGADAPSTGAPVTVQINTPSADDWWSWIGVELLPASASGPIPVLPAIAAFAPQPIPAVQLLPRVFAAPSVSVTGTVSLVGSVGKATRVTSGTTITGVYGQSPTAGNLLVAAVSRVGSTATASPTSTASTGWTRLLPTNFVTNIGVGSATACTNLVDIWYRVATGGDAAPTFTMTNAGGTTTFAMMCAIYELAGAKTAAPLDVSGTQSSGGTSATITTTTTTTSANVTTDSGFAISIATRERTAGIPTISYSTSWVNGLNDGVTDLNVSSVGHTGTAYFPGSSSGATLTDITTWSGTGTSSFGCGAIVVILPGLVTTTLAAQPQPAVLPYTVFGQIPPQVFSGSQIQAQAPPPPLPVVVTPPYPYQPPALLSPQVLGSPPTGGPTPIAETDAAGETDSIAVSVTVPLADTAAEIDAETAKITEIPPAVVYGPVPAPPPPRQLAPQVLTFSAGPVTSITEADAAAEIDAVVTSATVPVADAAAETDAISVVIAGIAPAVVATPPAPPPPPAPVRPQILLFTSPGVTFVTEQDAAAEIDAVAVSSTVPETDVAGSADKIAVQINEIPPALVATPLPPPVPPRQLAPQVFTGPPSGATNISEQDAAGETDSLSVSAQIAVADTAGEIDALAVSASASLSDAAGETDSPQITATVPLPDLGAEADAVMIMATIAVADVAGSLDSSAMSASVSLADAAGAPDSVQIAATTSLADMAAEIDANVGANTSFVFRLPDAAAATESWYVVVTGAPDLSEWSGSAYLPRWSATPAGEHWGAVAQRPRWRAESAYPRWRVQPAGPRWRATLMNFDPISALSPENINVNWDSHFAGLEIDPTGQTAGQAQLAVTMAFPVSSGNVLAPAQPATWYTGTWYTGTSVKGWIAYVTVGPAGAVTLTSGVVYDVWSQIHGTPDSPVKFVGQLRVY
jgi:hypothetical protein